MASLVDAVPPSPKSHAYVRVSLSESAPVAVKATGSLTLTVPDGLRCAVTVGSWLVAVMPQALDVWTPAAISMPASMCLRKSGSLYDAWVCPMPVYHIRPPSNFRHQEIG